MLIQKIINKIIDLKHRINPKRWGNKSIVWYAGYTPKQWSPDSIKTGIGGSELALINLSKEWSKLGYQVTVHTALKEKDYCVKVSGNPYAQETQENLAYKIVELLKNQQKLEEIRQEIQELV